MTRTSTTIIGVFSNREKARQAVSELKAMGFLDQQIGYIARDEDGKTGLKNDPTDSRWEEGTGIGAAAGAATGAGLGLAVAAGLISPVGPIIAGGALVALIASAGVGATVGTVVGGLIGLGVPEEDASYYEQEVHAGKYVVTVNAGDRGSEAKSLFLRLGGFERADAGSSHLAESTSYGDRNTIRSDDLYKANS
jgi:hypothetical protein